MSITEIILEFRKTEYNRGVTRSLYPARALVHDRRDPPVTMSDLEPQGILNVRISQHPAVCALDVIPADDKSEHWLSRACETARHVTHRR